MSNEGREHHIYKRNCSLFSLCCSRLIFPHRLNQYNSFVTLPAFRLFYYHYIQYTEFGISMGWLSSIFPCSQPRSKGSSIRSRSPSSLQDYQRHAPSFIDRSLLPQKPNRIVRKPCSRDDSSVRISEYPDEESILDETRPRYDQHRQFGIAHSDSSSLVSDDRTILMPEPDEDMIRIEIRNTEKNLTALPSPQPATTTSSSSLSSAPPPAVTAPRRTSWTTTRTSACLDMGPIDILGSISEAIEEEQEEDPKESPASNENRAPSGDISHIAEQSCNTNTISKHESQIKPRQSHSKRASETKREERDPHSSTRVSQRPSLIEIFDLLRTSQRTSYKLNLDFSPKFYANPFSPGSPCSSSTTAFSPPMSPASSCLPLSPTLSDETIMIDGIETACAVQIAGRKGPEEQARAAQDAFGFHWDWK